MSISPVRAQLYSNKRKNYSGFSNSPWASDLTNRLALEAEKYGISEYPTYLQIFKTRSNTLWKHLPLVKEGVFTTKQLRDKYIERVSPKIDHTEISAREIKRIEEIFNASKKDRRNWTEVSKILFYEKKQPDAKYRPPGQLKNYWLSTDRKIMRRMSKISCPPLMVEQAPLSSPKPSPPENLGRIESILPQLNHASIELDRLFSPSQDQDLLEPVYSPLPTALPDFDELDSSRIAVSFSQPDFKSLEQIVSDFQLPNLVGLERLSSLDWTIDNEAIETL